MDCPSASEGVVRFGVFEVDLATGELRKGGLRVHLQEHPFRVLAMLLAQPGRLVPRDELRAHIWPEAVFVDFEHGLDKAVNKLRVALGDSANSPRFVETLARRGYRFIARVEGREVAEPRAAGLRLLFESRTIPLVDGENILGRDEVSVARLDSASVSRRHARILVQGRQAMIEDLGSKNGTLVRNRRVEGTLVLSDGDDIQIGALHLTFRAPEARASAETA